MKRIALTLSGGLLMFCSMASPCGATITWNLANPSQIVAYRVGKGVITVASAPQYTCGGTELVLDAKQFVYDYKVGTAKGMLCLASYVAPMAAYYQIGSPASVTVNTKKGAVTVPVVPPPPTSPAIGHLPFH
jgi:hypothetical protein